MYHVTVSAQGVDERMINGHYYYYYKARVIIRGDHWQQKCVTFSNLVAQPSVPNA